MAAVNLGLLREQEGDLAVAESLYRLAVDNTDDPELSAAASEHLNRLHGATPPSYNSRPASTAHGSCDARTQ